MSGEPTLAEIIRNAIASRLSDLHVALPGRIESYDPSTQTAEVLPMIRRAIPDTAGAIQHEDLPKIPNVPVLFPRGSADTYSITWPIAVGDFVLLVFNSWAIGQWRETGAVSNPVDLGKHGLGNPIAIPGIAPKTGSIPTDPAALVIEGAEVKVGPAAVDFVAMNAKVLAELGSIASALSSHTHGGVTAGSGTSGPPAAPPYTPPADVASTKLKAES